MGGGWPAGRLLGLDLETTGVDRREDVPVSFALVEIVGGVVQRRRAGLVDPGREIPPGATAVHGITTERARAEGCSLAEALLLVGEALLRASAEKVPVVGMNLAFDLSIIDQQLRHHSGDGLAERGFDGPVLDVLVLDRHYDRFRKGKRRLEHLCAHYAVGLERSHEAGADAEAAVGVLLALCRCYPELASEELVGLTDQQAIWHREWAESYAAWRAGTGRSGLDPDELAWPLLPAPAALA